MRAKRIEVMSADRVLLFTVALMSGYISITRFCLSDWLRFRINQNYILSNYLKPCCMFGCLPVCENVLFCFFFIEYAVWVPRKGIFFWFVCYHVSYKIEQNVYFCLTWFCFLLACFVAPWLPYKYLFFLCYFFHRRSTQYCGLSFFQCLFLGVCEYAPTLVCSGTCCSAIVCVLIPRVFVMSAVCYLWWIHSP